MIGHHGYTSQSAPRVSCVNRTTGGVCTAPNGVTPTTWPKTLSVTAGPLGTGSTGKLATTQMPRFARVGDLIYYPAVTSTAVAGFPNGSVGAGCLNLLTQSNCAYVPLASLTNETGQSNVNGITGFTGTATNAYGTLTNGKEVCFALTTGIPCAGQPYSTNSPPNNDAAGTGPTDYVGITTAVSGKFYTVSNGQNGHTTAPHAPTVSCFDPVSNTPCSGWSPQVIGDPNAAQSLSLFPLQNTSGTATAICAVTGNKTTAAPIVTCYDLLNASPVTPPAALTSLFPSGSRYSVIFQGTNPNVGGNLRTYFPMYSQDRTRLGTTLCYSWTNAAPCGGYPINHPTVNGGDTHDYGYIYAGDTGCMYGAGDTGFLFSFYSTTGVAGC